MKLNLGHKKEPLSVLKMVSPQDGGWSLTPTENLLRGLRNIKESVSLEIFGSEGAVSYLIRTDNGRRLEGMLRSYFPQARITHRVDMPGEPVIEKDWMRLAEDELAMVMPVSLEKATYLPLQTYEDQVLNGSQMDPLAGVIGMLANSTKRGGNSGDRLGVRVLVQPAEEDWSLKYQQQMQRRRDGDDREGKPDTRDSTISLPLLALIGAIGGGGLLNYWLYTNQMMGEMLLANLGMVGAAASGIFLWKKLSMGKKRTYMDEKLVEEKLKSLAFWTEIQLVRVFRSPADELSAEDSIRQLLDVMRQFDHPAGNSLQEGKIVKYQGVDFALSDENDKVVSAHPFLGGDLMLRPISPKRARRTAISAREVAGLWHPPLGTDEMASMERVATGTLIPYLEDLAGSGDDAGPLVGYAGDGTHEIYLPESAIRKHALFVGRSGVGKSTMVKHIVMHKLLRKAAGKDDGAIVVVDPHADLVRDILKVVPLSIAHKVRLLDFGRNDRVPALNLMDPLVFPDRDRCVDTIVQTVKHLWEHWGGRLEDLLKRSLLIIYEYNTHPDTPRNEMLTMLDILALLDEGKEVGSGKQARTEMNEFQRRVMSRVTDPSLKRWFNNFLGWPRETRSEAMGPVQSRMGAYASDRRAKVVLGQRESTIFLTEVLREGQVLLVATAQGQIGVQPAALMGGTVVSLVESALREQESIDPSLRKKCLLVCDEFQTVTGAPWENLLAEIRKYGGSLLLSTQSLVRLDTGERRLKAGILGNTGCFVGYQMSSEDAKIVAAEMDDDRVRPNYLVNLDPHCAYVRINSDTRCFPAFSLKTLPPPDLYGGSQESVDAVVAGMSEYTCDFMEALEKVNAETEALIQEEKVGLGGASEPGFGGGGAAKPVGAYGMLSGAGAGRGDGGKKESGGLPPVPPALVNALNNVGVDPGVIERRPAAVATADAAMATAGVTRKPSFDRVQDGPLKGVPHARVEDSKYTTDVLTAIIQASPKDPGIVAAIDKRLGDLKDAVRRDTRRDERDTIMAEAMDKATDQVRREMEVERERVMAEARDEVREEMLRKTLAEVNKKAAAAPSAALEPVMAEAGVDSVDAGESVDAGGSPAEAAPSRDLTLLKRRPQ